MIVYDLYCDGDGCREAKPFDSAMLITERAWLLRIAKDHGWKRTKGKDYCQDCARALAAKEAK